MNNNKKILMKIFEVMSFILMAGYPCIYMFTNNIGEAKFINIIPITFVFIGFSFFLFILFYIFLKDLSKTTLVVNITLFILLNFKMLEDSLHSIFSSLYYWHMVIIFLFIVINVVLLYKQYAFKETHRINKLIALIYFVLICLSVVQAIPKIIDLNNKKAEIQTSQNQVAINMSTNNSDKPNFYYLIFDEYGGPENLQYFMNFDNHKFYNNLEKLGCNISYNSRNRDYETHKIIADLVNFKKVSYNNFTVEASKEYRANPPLMKIFKQYGYKLNKITNDPTGLQSGIDYKNELEKSTTETEYGMIISNTILYPLNFNISDNYVDNLNNQIIYLYDSVKLDGNGVFSFAHFDLPHAPFVFDKNGNKNANIKYKDVINDEVYLNQLLYTNHVIEKFMKLIIEKDPNAVVLIQSDHGSRNVHHRYYFHNGPKPTDEQFEYMKSILNILYYKGEKVDINGLTGYDTLKMVVSSILNVEIDTEN